MAMIEITPEDAGQLEVIAETFRAGDRSIRNSLDRSLRTSTKIASESASDYIASALPKKGGLSHWVAGQPIKVKSDLRPGNTAIRFTMSRAGHDFAALDRGLDRHPLFGDRDQWYMQHLPQSHWWEQAMTDSGGKVIDSVRAALDETVSEIGAKL